jgi:hypothetical protein
VSVLYGVFLKFNATLDLGLKSPINMSYPTTLQGHVELLVWPERPVTLLVWLIALVLFIMIVKAWRRTFIIVWIAATCILFVNPWSARLLIDYVTTPNIYWRMFYILPFPLIVGVGGSEFLKLLGRVLKLRAVLIVAPIAVFSLLAYFVMLLDNYYAWMGIYPYKFYPQQIEFAREVIEHSPPGTLLAPPEIGSIVPIFSADYRLISAHPEIVSLWMAAYDAPSEANLRIGAAQFVAGDTQRRNDFLRILDQDIVEIMVMTKPIYEELQSSDRLTAHGFDEHYNMDSYVLVWQSQSLS